MAEHLEPELGLENFGDAVRAAMLRVTDGFPYGGQWIFSGVQRSGKTLLLIHLVKEIVERCPKVMIISNISIFGVPCIPYTGPEMFDDPRYKNGKDGVIYILDEIQTLYSSMESRNMPLSLITVWSQSSKNRRLILGTTQRYSRAAKAIREQTTFHYECRRPLLAVFYRYRVLDGANYDDAGNYAVPEGDQMPGFKFYIPPISSMLMYNTLEVVNRKPDPDQGPNQEKKVITNGYGT